MKPAILIVEDNDLVRTSLRDWLSATFPDHHFMEATSGEEAVALACAQPPDIVLMDLMLPQMNGIEATRRIKAVVPQAQVVMVTLHEDTDYQANAAAAGASAYVIKRRMHTELVPILTALSSNPATTALNGHAHKEN